MPKNKKLYLVVFDFISGEYHQVFHKTFYAENEIFLENKIRDLLNNYYGVCNFHETQNDVYFYFKSEIAVKLLSWKEISSLKQIADELKCEI